MLKIGLIGVGGISGEHIPAWDKMEGAELSAICDIRPERMERYPEKRRYTDFNEMLENEEIDILDICLPTYLHADYAVKAMEKGIHVICEKPVSLKEEDVARVYLAAQKMNVKFMVAQVLRFWPEYELIKEIYDTEKYGKLLSGYMGRLGTCPKWSWDNWMQDPLRSGLVPYDLHVHDLDFMVYAFGKPVSVQSHRSKRPEQDYISAVYKYDDFFITAEAAWYAAPLPFGAGYRFQFEDALITYIDGRCMVYQNDGTVLNLSAGENGGAGSLNLPRTNAYANEIHYFAECVLMGKAPDRIKPAELETVIKILNGI
ncbi:MAG: Gfo/Idh/MocA family oxidoreductase [Oscillospiraceae bacterium]|nr:Gfo/Idh/MocA family oxidoreductase [Oscillospiraceae bacterium]